MLKALGKNPTGFLRDHIKLAIPMPLKSKKDLRNKVGTCSQKLKVIFIQFCIFFSEKKGETQALPCMNEVFQIQIKHSRLENISDLGNDFQKQKSEFEISSCCLFGISNSEKPPFVGLRWDQQSTCKSLSCRILF